MNPIPSTFVDELTRLRPDDSESVSHPKVRYRDEYVNVIYQRDDRTLLSPEERRELLALQRAARERQATYARLNRDILRKQHLRVNTDRTKEVTRHMSPGTLGAMMMILGEVAWSDNHVLMSAEGRPMKVRDFQELFGGKGRVTTIRILGDLRETGFLLTDGETRSTVYLVNPTFHVMGKMVEKENFVRLYNDEVKKLTKEIRVIDGRPRRISPDALGFFYKLLPFIHISMNTVCHNPNEVDKDNVRLALESELHELTCLSRNTVSKYMKELNHFGVLATLHIYGKKSIIPNPKYLYRGADAEAYQVIIQAMEKRDREDLY